MSRKRRSGRNRSSPAAPQAPEPPPPSRPAAPKATGRRRALAAAVALALLALVVWAARPRLSHPNLVFVTIDTLRADRIGAWGYAGAHTPPLAALAGRGTRFAAAQASVPLTGPSHATIFTGRYPPLHGVRDNVVFPLGDEQVTLAERLREHGYHTAAFVAAYPVASDFGIGQGFDEFHENFHEESVPGQGAERPGNEVADEVIAWLRQPREGPFFAWMHLYDPHAPYDPPPPWRERLAGRPYDGEVAFADEQLGRVLQALREAGHEHDTLVVAMADHGESLGEHGEATHAILIYESTLHVPLILAGPGVPGARVVEEPVGSVDVLPTVMGLLGLEVPEGLSGRDLRRALAGERLAPEALYAESLFGRLNCRWASLRSITLGDWKLIRGAETELYDIARDPGEQSDLAASEPERRARLERLLETALQQMAPGGDSARTAAPISPEQEERLRSLGYASGSGGGGELDQPGLPDPRTHVGLYEQVQKAMQVHGPAARTVLDTLAQMVERDPGNPYAHYALGNLAYRTGRLRRAAQAYARAVELDPDRPGMRLSYGRLLRDMGRLEESAAQLRIAVEQTTPGDIRTRASLAETLIDLGQLDEAESIVAAAEAAQPNHLDAIRVRGLLLVARGRVDEGVAALTRTARGPSPDPWIEIARIRLDAGQPAAALAAAREALARNNGHPWALALEGHALLLQGSREEGLRALQRSLQLGPRRPEVWLSLARGFEAAGEPGPAAECHRRAEAFARG